MIPVENVIKLNIRYPSMDVGQSILCFFLKSSRVLISPGPKSSDEEKC